MYSSFSTDGIAVLLAFATIHKRKGGSQGLRWNCMAPAGLPTDTTLKDLREAPSPCLPVLQVSVAGRQHNTAGPCCGQHGIPIACWYRFPGESVYTLKTPS
mmetsp:Transcript_21463/g.59615  ORF Transcript_21463/g.59615 Transcript_21463/m.59615 type:complete len:101 (+) Transcript_21463:65-367(+)